MNKNIIFSVFLFLFWSIVIAYITLAAVPLNPVSLRFENKMNILSVVPEGWGFFTRNPREPAIFIYKRDSITNRFSLINYPMPAPQNYFGISRKMRKINIELFSILPTLNDSIWQKGETDAFTLSCDSITSTKGIFDNSALRGSLLIVKQERLPWAWVNSKNKLIMPYKKLVLNIY